MMDLHQDISIQGIKSDYKSMRRIYPFRDVNSFRINKKIKAI
jgi:hypothetical protein